jgi:hypothetical protein
MLVWSIQERSVEGVYHAVSPNPVTNRVFSKELAHALRRPFFLSSRPGLGFEIDFWKNESSFIGIESNKLKQSSTIRIQV